MVVHKRAKLFGLDALRRRLPQVSQSLLSMLIRLVRADGLHELSDNRADFRNARDAIVQIQTGYDPNAANCKLASEGWWLR